MTTRVFFTIVATICLSSCDLPSGTPFITSAPFAVGSTTIFIHDESRGYDSTAGVDSGIRTLITEIWYPVDHGAVADDANRPHRATYGDYVFGNRNMHRLMMTRTTFFHLTPDTVRDGVNQDQIDTAIKELFSRKRASFVDAPMVSEPASVPVVVMSHGDAGSRYNMETTAEHLAAHGYLVIAPEHTGNSPFSMTGSDPALLPDTGNPEFRARMSNILPLLNEHGAYGREENFGQSYAPSSQDRDTVQFLRNLDRSMLERLDDLRATLTELSRLNTEGRFAGRLDLTRIGLMGRSFGGATTMMGLAMEAKFAAGFAVVPPGWTDPRPALPQALLAPSGQESVLLAAEGPFPLTTITKPTVLLSGAEDGLIIGLARSQANGSGLAVPTADNPHPLLRSAYESTDAPVVWGLLADSNHASFGVSGDYWWPELKPSTQTRYFEPDTTFELVAAELAHQMQKALALAFFDLTIRGDTSAEERLLNNEYENDGLMLEFRNF